MNRRTTKNIFNHSVPLEINGKTQNIEKFHDFAMTFNPIP